MIAEDVNKSLLIIHVKNSKEECQIHLDLIKNYLIKKNSSLFPNYQWKCKEREDSNQFGLKVIKTKSSLNTKIKYK